jgi:hypothetical protein
MLGFKNKKKLEIQKELNFLKYYINTFFEQLNIKSKKIYILMYTDFKRRESVFNNSDINYKIKFYKLYTAKIKNIYLSNYNMLNNEDKKF